MVAVPAWVWRFGVFVRALIVTAAFGLVTGLLAYFGSNLWIAGVAAFVSIMVIYTPFLARRMVKLWPGAKDLSGDDRVTVVTAARTGADIGDSRLAPAVIEYSDGLKAAADRRLWRWFLALLGSAALVVAILDTLFSPVGEYVVSWLYFAYFPIEAWWWPRRQSQLVANAEEASEAARQLVRRADAESHESE
ncbi:MAG: hypothetical protein QOH60_5122 [Mycobacterium sp.]|jgi:Flp pilus assembly protein TadB|nr:hypothetical protein [Mycobacterium sp.]